MSEEQSAFTEEQIPLKTESLSCLLCENGILLPALSQDTIGGFFASLTTVFSYSPENALSSL